MVGVAVIVPVIIGIDRGGGMIDAELKRLASVLHTIMVCIAGIVILKRLSGILEAVLIGVADVGEQKRLTRIEYVILVGVAGIEVLKRFARILHAVLVGVADVVIAVEKLGQKFRTEDRSRKIQD